jgi:thioredoxin 1
MIAPKYEALAREYTPKGAVFCKCDTDAAQDVAHKFQISAMPSFLFLRNGTKVDLVRGAIPS